MKYEELTGKSESELYQLIGDLKKEQLNLRFQRKSNQLANTARCRVCRRDLARIQTRLKQLKSA